LLFTHIVVAHRLKTVRSADNIIVLDEGRVVEQGTHDELILQKGLYYDLWTIQQESSRWKMSS
jgi:ATP-binding cassette subfamily B protein